MSAGLGESAPHIPAADLPRPYTDTRDLTPFRKAVVRTPVRGLAGSVGGAGHRRPGAGRGTRDAGRRGRGAPAGQVGGPAAGKTAKAVHAAIFGSTDPTGSSPWPAPTPAGRALLPHGRAAGLPHGGHLRASELLQHGLSLGTTTTANRYAAVYLAGVVTRVEVAERIEVPVLFSEEAVFLALSHSLRETGQTEAALRPSPGCRRRCRSPWPAARWRPRWDGTTRWWRTPRGCSNADDSSAALLLVRGRSLRRLGAHSKARRHSRRSSAVGRPPVLRNDALTDRALLVLDNGRRSLNPRDWLRGRPAELETFEVIRKDVDERRLWEQEWKQFGGD